MSLPNPYGAAALVAVKLKCELVHLDQLLEPDAVIEVPEDLAQAFVTAGIADLV